MKLFRDFETACGEIEALRTLELGVFQAQSECSMRGLFGITMGFTVEGCDYNFEWGTGL